MSENNVYRQARRKAAEADSELNDYKNAAPRIGIDHTKLHGIETNKANPTPDVVVQMAQVYNAPELCSYYCANQCEIGRDTPMPLYEDLNQISTRLMSAMHRLNAVNENIYEILEDGVVDESEKADFEEILKVLDKIEYSAKSLKLWAKTHGQSN